MKPNSNIRSNNFDLIRLFAVSQVVLFHGVEHLKLSLTGAGKTIFWLFPGVPIFFVISGYLISLSFESNSNLKKYLINRVLRIYPALWVCFGFSLLTLTALGYWDSAHISLLLMTAWITGQVTVVQFYNPSFLRHFGVGVLNGSLWTIPVELQFYILVPFISLFLRVFGTLQKYNALILTGIGGFAIINAMLVGYKEIHADAFVVKVVFITIIPYLFMFLTGMYVQRNMTTLRPFLEGKALYWIVFYIGSSIALQQIFGLRAGSNDLNIISFFILALATVSCAFSVPYLSDRLLKGQDISYGTY